MVIPFHDGDDKTAHRQCHRVVGANCYRRVRMFAGSLPRFGVQSPTEVTLLMAPGDEPMD